MIKLEDYVPIEVGVANYVKSAWNRQLRPLVPLLKKAMQQERWQSAMALVDRIDVPLIAKQIRKGIEGSTIAAITFGAMLAKGDADIVYKTRPIPPVVQPTIDLWQNTLQDVKDSLKDNLQLVIDAQDRPEAAKSEDSCAGHHHINPVVLLLKGDVLTLAQKLNAAVLDGSNSLIDIGANLATSRLVSLGFLGQAMASGIEVYQRTAALDGRTCPVCRTLHGKTFSVQSAFTSVLNLVTQTDPDTIKQMAPFPSQSQAAVQQMRTMTPDALQITGLSRVPSHPGCRCREVLVGTVPETQVLPIGAPKDHALPDVPVPEDSAVEALASKDLSPVTEAAKQVLGKELSDDELLALDKVFTQPEVNDWLRICTSPLIQKAEASFSFCSAFNPKKMGQLVSAADDAVKAWELDDELKAWRIATGDFAEELLSSAAEGSIIHDKGFALWTDKFVPQDGTAWAKIHVTAPKGTKAVKIGDQYAFPSDTKFQVYKTKVDKNGIMTFYVQPIEETASTKLAGELPKAVDAVKTPDIVPAGTVEREVAAKTMGNDFLDYKQLKHVGAKPGGSVPGETMVDKDGQKWIVKHVANTEIARNEVLSAKLYEALHVEVPDLRLVQGPNGETWVASKWVDGFQTVASKLQSAERLPGLYDNFVVDAWLSNWDVVGATYDNIGLLNGRAYRIDVGGALRFRAQGGLKTEAMFPNEVVDLANMRNPSVSPLVSKVFKDITQSELNAGAAKVLSLPDETIRSIIRQYGPLDSYDNERLADKMITRKRDLEKKFPDALGAPPVKNVSPPVAEEGKRVTESEVKAIIDSRLNGYAMKTDFDQIEGQNVLIALEKTKNGGDVVEATLKLRGQAQVALKKLMSNTTLADAGNPLAATIRSAQADLDSKLVTFIKGFAKQIDTSQPIRDVDIQRFDAVRDARKALKDAINSAMDAVDSDHQGALHALYGHYSDMIRKLDDVMGPIGTKASWSNGKVMVSSYTGDWESVLPKPAQPGASSGIKLTKTSGQWRKKDTQRGFAHDTGQTTGMTLNKWVYSADGVEIEYYGSSDYAALKGLLRIRVEGDPAQSAGKVFDVLEKLGVMSHRASAAEQEYLYLSEMAYLKPDLWKNAVKVMDDSRPLEEKIAYLRHSVKAAFGIDDAAIDAELMGRRQAFDQANSYNVRADMKGPEWDAFARDYRLVHSNTGSMSMPELINTILNSGGRVAPTVDKIRRGIPLSGMSPSADLGSGGADYFFTRIRKKQSTVTSGGQLVFKADPIRRTTTVSYGSDMYGRTDETSFIHQNRATSISQWKNFASYGGSDETIIKGGVSLFDDLDYIAVKSSSEKTQALKIMRDHGLSQWPDGRTLEEVVRYPGERVGAPEPVKAATPPKATPDWAAKDPGYYAYLKDYGNSDETIKSMFKQDGLYTEPKPAPAPSAPAPKTGYPAWLNEKSQSAVSYYEKQKAFGYDDASIKVTIQSKGWDSWLKKDVPVATSPASAFATIAQGEMPQWAYGYEEYWNKWTAAGKSPAQIEKDLMSYVTTHDVYPSWVKTENKAVKEMYKSMKEGVTSLDHEAKVHQWLYEQGYVSTPPPPPPSAYPKWAFGYEKYYDKWLDQGMDMPAIQKEMALYAKAKNVYPSWLNPKFKDDYKAFKSIGYTDAEILDSNPGMMLK